MHLTPPSRPRRIFSEAFKIARLDRRLSHADVAARVGRHKSYIEDLESGATLPDPRTMTKLAVLFPALQPFRGGTPPQGELRAVPPPASTLPPPPPEEPAPMPPVTAVQTPPAPSSAFPSFLRWMRMVSACKAAAGARDFVALLELCAAENISASELLEALR